MHSNLCFWHDQNFGGIGKYCHAHLDDNRLNVHIDANLHHVYPVTDDPQKAIIVVIVNSRTHLGSNLITDYAGEGSGKGGINTKLVHLLVCIELLILFGPFF